MDKVIIVALLLWSAPSIIGYVAGMISDYDDALTERAKERNKAAVARKTRA